MSQCVITQLITSNKWKGKVIHPIVIGKARSIAKYHKSVRNAVIYLDKQFKLKIQKEFDPTEKTDPVKYVDFINDFFKVSNERSKK